MATFKILGITDEKTECECCGRTNLKCTVALEFTDAEGNSTGDITYYGRDCASRAMHGNNKSANVKAIDAEARGIEYARKWIGKTEKHTAAVVSSGVRTSFGPCYVIGEFAIQFPSGTVVSA